MLGGSENMSKICYVFKTAILCDGEGYIYAADVEEAKRLIMDKEWDDLDDIAISEVIEVTELREDK